MSNKLIKKIAIITSGGDSSGMNVAIKSIVNSCINNNIKPYLVKEGFKGLTEGLIFEVTKKDVDDIDKKGGTIIFSSRFPEFKEVKTREKALKKIKENSIDAIVVIGGDGSYMGAFKLSEMGVKTICLPGTIDNDISSTDLTIGFLTSLEYVVNSLDSIRDTSNSHNRINIVEVMGRYCGDIAIYSALATNAEVLSIPERKLTEKQIIEQVINSREKEKKRAIIVLVTEHLYKINDLAKKIESETSYEVRSTVLGHTQRGGKPISFERVLATQMGAFAVQEILKGKTGVTVNVKDFKLITKDIIEVVNMKRDSKRELLDLYDFSK